jgi:4-cresol dehydrogenase (hydroxylating)
MNRVLEVNEDLAYAVVEPGVRFSDLCDRLRAAGGRLWASVPVLGWGSVIGNTLDHGWGYTPNGDHASNQCGMEVVLPSGDLLRTGMGAMTNGGSWHVHRRGFGPSADGLFMQSGLGIVTRMGVWLMPRPECYVPCRVTVAEAEPGRMVDTLRRLMLERTVVSHPLLRYEPGGGWDLRFALHGHQAVVDAQLGVVRRAFSAIPDAELVETRYAGDEVEGATDPFERVQAGIAGMEALQLVRLRGGEHGGQLDFSPVTPLTGRDLMAMRDLVRPLLERHGFSYTPGIIVTPRSLVHICPLVFDTTDEVRVRAAFDLYAVLVRAATKAGYGLYRTHLRFMDLVADQFDFGGHALRRFNEAIKDALDPNGVLAPGKQGIWPGSAGRPP